MLVKDIPAILRTGMYVLASRLPYYPTVASFDVTNKCTLNCKHCYWQEQDKSEELPDEEFIKRIIQVKRNHPTILQAVWLGGEPLLRAGLIEKCKNLFSFNEIDTNGTLPLPNWKDMMFVCSVDGTKKYHEQQRGKNTYEKIRDNINRKGLDVTINFCITRLNKDCIEDFVEEWRNTYVKGAGFSFYTPIAGKNNAGLWLGYKERDIVIDRLITLKRKYPKFITISEALLRNFKSDRCQQITEKCRTDYAVFNSMCFDSSFRRKFPCVLGEKADCTKCGCVGSVMGEALKQGERSMIMERVRFALSRH